GIAPGDKSNIGPRLGYAYHAAEKLVVRGSFGKLYLMSPHQAGLIILGGFGEGGPTPVTPVTIDGIHPLPGVFMNPFPQGVMAPSYATQGEYTFLGLNVTGPFAQNKTPYQYQWSQGFEYRLPAD